MNRLCVIGDPVGHSLSPLLHNAALERLGLQNEFVFEKQKVSKAYLAEFMKRVRQKEFYGLSVTMPHKRSILPFLDDLSDEAKLAQAVNTLTWDGERLLGHNTDGEGCVQVLEAAKVPITEQVIVVLGAGGAAGAIVNSLAMKGPKMLYVLNRTLSKAKTIAQVASEASGSEVFALDLDLIEEVLTNADVIINATSVGMKGVPKGTIVLPRLINRSMTVMDLVYEPVLTKLLKEAKSAGAKTISGTEMLLQQGALQFKLFTGKDAPLEAMRAALKKGLEANQ
jgi:shikimate dehydrogenase